MISKTYPTENQSEEVSVLEWDETIPKDAEVIGMVKVGDRSKKEFDLGKDNKEGLGRLDISFGVRFGK